MPLYNVSAAGAIAQGQELNALAYGAGLVLEDAAAAISASETGVAVSGLGGFEVAVVHIITTDQNLPHATNEIEIVVQTSYDEGSNWVDVESIHYANADDNATENRIVVIGGPQSSAVARAGTDAALADDTKLDIPLGDRLRLRVVFANTTSSPSITFTARAYVR